MGSLTNYAEQKVLDHLNGTAYTPVATVYAGLCSADPTDAATGASCNELSGTNYARAAITFAAAATRQITQTGAVTFPQAGGSWGTATHWVVTDNATAGSGNVLAHGALAASKVIVSGNTPSIASGEVYVSIAAGEVSNYAANGMLDRMFRNQALTISTVYVGLATATLSDSTTGSTVSEPSGNGYARKRVYENGGGTPDWDLAVSGDPSYVDNNDDVDLGPASGGSWGTCVAVFTATASTVGEILMYDNDMTDQAVGDGDTARFPAGDLDWQAS